MAALFRLGENAAVHADTLSYRHSEDAEFKDKIHFVKFDVDQLPELTKNLGVRAMPTFYVFKGGKKVGELVGANPPALLATMRQHL